MKSSLFARSNTPMSKQSSVKHHLFAFCVTPRTLILCALACQTLFSAEPSNDSRVISQALAITRTQDRHTRQDKSFTYDPVATATLQQLIDNLNDATYPAMKDQLNQFVRQNNPDPNIKSLNTPLLASAINYNDVSFTELLLSRGASLKIAHPPSYLSRARTTKMAQLLIDHKADPHAVNSSNEHLLHTAASIHKPAEMLILFANIVDVNHQNWQRQSPLHKLFASLNKKSSTEEVVNLTAPLIWENARFDTKDRDDKTPLDLLQINHPALVIPIQTLRKVIPYVKKEKDLAYQTTMKPLLNPLLGQHVPNPMVDLVVKYLPSSYEKKFLNKIMCRMQT